MNQCPWTEFKPDPYPFCEDALCSWVREPANTWTNIGYLIVGLYLWRRRREDDLFLYFSFASLFLAFGSGLFHMTTAFWAKKLDVMAMFLLSSTSILLSLKKRFTLTPKQFFAFFILINLFSYPLIGRGQAGGIFFLVQILFVVMHEIWVGKKIKQNQKNKLLIKLVAVFVASFLLSQLDQKRILCDPQNHILTGHGIWHLGTAYCIYLVTQYFSPKDSK